MEPSSDNNLSELAITQGGYSIDESFIDLNGVQGDLVERSHKIRSRILQWVGIPCGIGTGRGSSTPRLG